jgi:hypothetical protein
MTLWCVQSRGVDISVLLSRVVRGVEDDTGGRQKPYTNFYTTAPDPLYLSQGTHHPHAPPCHLLVCSMLAHCSMSSLRGASVRVRGLLCGAQRCT